MGLRVGLEEDGPDGLHGGGKEIWSMSNGGDELQAALAPSVMWACSCVDVGVNMARLLCLIMIVLVHDT